MKQRQGTLLIRKLFFGVLGCLFALLGYIGIWIPGVPTTVFLLLAIWAFSNSSKRLHKKLYRIRALRASLLEVARFQKEGTVSFRAKVISQTCSWISFLGVSIVLHKPLVSLIVGLLALSCTVFMTLVPTASVEKSNKLNI